MNRRVVIGRRVARGWHAARRGFYFAAIGCLAACGGSLFQTKVAPATIYVLMPTTPGAVQTGAAVPVGVGADLAILRPKVAVGLETDRIAVLYADRRLDYFANARWAGTLGEVVQSLAVQVLQSTVGLRNVSGDSSAFASAYWLEIDVSDFQAEYTADSSAPLVLVRLKARLGRESDRRIIARFDADATQAAADNRLTAIVAAFEHAVNSSLAELGTDAATVIDREAPVR